MNITIANAQLVDTGIYTCRVFEKDVESSENTTETYVFVSPTRGRLNITEQSPIRIKVDENKNVDLMIRFVAKPRDYKKKWIKVRCVSFMKIFYYVI